MSEQLKPKPLFSDTQKMQVVGPEFWEEDSPLLAGEMKPVCISTGFLMLT